VSVSIDVPTVGKVTFEGSYDPNTGQWSLDGYCAGPIPVGGGWVVLRDLHMRLTNTSLTLDGKATVLDIKELANANLHGQIYSDGRFISTVDAHALQLGGFTLSNTTVILTNDNPGHVMMLNVHSDLAILGLRVPVDGYIDAHGNYELKGGHNLTLAGFTLTNGSFELKNGTGLQASGTLVLPLHLGSANVSGWIHSDGTFLLSAPANLSLGGFPLANSTVTISRSGVQVSGTVRGPAGMSASVSGALNTDGTFSLTGVAPLGGNLAGGTASFTLRGNALGQVSLGVQSVRGFNLGGNPSLSGTLHATLQVTVRPGGDFNYSGSAWGALQLSYRGLHISFASFGARVSDSGFTFDLGRQKFGGFIPVWSNVGSRTVRW
jgi:hypothetical protein